MRAYVLKFLERFFGNILIYKNRYMYKGICHKYPFHLEKMSQQRTSNSVKTRRSAILHFWNNDQRPPAPIFRITMTPKYNIMKIKQQGTIEDRTCNNGRLRKITAGDNRAFGQWIRRHNEATSKELASITEIGMYPNR